MGKRVALSWSGGKDSCFSLHKLREEGHDVVALVSMVSRDHRRNHAHGIPFEPLELQAAALGLPLALIDSAGGYESQLKQGLAKVRAEYGADAVAFGTLYGESDREWNAQVAEAAGLEALFPLWSSRGQARERLQEWLDLGYSAVVCRANDAMLDASWVGKPLNEEFYEKISRLEVCPMGEAGEYHTIVTDGPLFQKRLVIESYETVRNAGLWSMDIHQAHLE